MKNHANKYANEDEEDDKRDRLIMLIQESSLQMKGGKKRDDDKLVNCKIEAKCKRERQRGVRTQTRGALWQICLKTPLIHILPPPRHRVF